MPAGVWRRRSGARAKPPSGASARTSKGTAGTRRAVLLGVPTETPATPWSLCPTTKRRTRNRRRRGTICWPSCAKRVARSATRRWRRRGCAGGTARCSTARTSRRRCSRRRRTAPRCSCPRWRVGARARSPGRRAPPASATSPTPWTRRRRLFRLFRRERKRRPPSRLRPVLRPTARNTRISRTRRWTTFLSETTPRRTAALCCRTSPRTTSSRSSTRSTRCAAATHRSRPGISRRRCPGCTRWCGC
mmetsp:Transcript_8031/g.34164  ORF Transcript_8031/g.34164 Transcript_8031/m.34164 type:complete len:247 (-) Transcript_8031:423-1163(-)